MARSVKRKPPSRVKYEHSHPTVSCRVSREVYDRLQKAKKREGGSFADILKIGLGIVEAQAKKERQVRKKARDEGYREGYAEAKQVYRVTYSCVVCGRSLTVSTREEKEAIKKYMQEHRWRHQECH